MRSPQVSIDDLQALRDRVLKENPPARSDAILAKRLWRSALRDSGREYENASHDRAFDSLTNRKRRDERDPILAAEAAAARVQEFKQFIVALDPNITLHAAWVRGGALKDLGKQNDNRKLFEVYGEDKLAKRGFIKAKT